MAAIHSRRSWTVPETAATPEGAYLERRRLIQGAGLAALAACLPGRHARAEENDPSADLYPAPRNPAFVLDRDITPEDVNATYNNFYEFGSHKQISEEARRLKTRPWEIAFDGLVEKPFVIAIDELLAAMPLEERLYRHRCVEAWSMTVPWTGFALSRLLERARPLASARYVRFETFHDPDMGRAQRQTWYPWPYVEGLTMAEAANELAFMVTGAYGKPMVNQFGAPLRLAVPWKYGFKSIKSIRRVSFTETRPVSFWEEIAPSEYGFWANVNPSVPHPRWSQETERVLHTHERVPTILFNGYGDQVAHLYAAMEAEQLYM
jgi:methionine sulfoxide reductase catalytic subunit